MPHITTITTPFMMNIAVNCYLVQGEQGFVLVDTGSSGKRAAIEQGIRDAGCAPGDLRLIVLTHGDFDHSGNAAYLRQTFGAPVALHVDDVGMVERGDMFWNRRPPNPLVRAMTGLLVKLAEADRFTPDITFQDGDDLTAHGFAARVVALPGHSAGNSGLLTSEGDLFCGDLLANTKTPQVWTIVDDSALMAASVERLNTLDIGTIYPGHGKPFTLAEFLAAQER